MSPVMYRQFSSLAEGLVAPRVLAPVGLMTRVHIQVVLQVLGQRELLPAELAREPTGGVVDCQMSFKAVFVGVFLIAVWVSARKVLSLGIGQLVILLIVLDRA
jgi:hypothetical protein